MSLQNVFKEVKVAIKNPGVLFHEHPKMRIFYNNTCDRILSHKHKHRLEIARSLPGALDQYRIPSDIGFKVLPPEKSFSGVQPLLKRCRELMADPSRAKPKIGKSYLNHLLQVNDLKTMPEFMNFVLDPQLLSVVTEYLGELPVLGSVFLWHAHTSNEGWSKSQLYHSDYDDIRQVKVFVFADAVDVDSGPLTLMPANISDNIRKALNNNNNRYGEYITDEKIRPLLPDGKECPLIGPAGTTALADTSRVLHFGSRVANRDRYMVAIQYLSLTNFIHSPFYTVFPYLYAHLIKDEYSLVQKAVLDPRIG